MPRKLEGGELLHHQGRRGPLQELARILIPETPALNWNILTDNDIQLPISPPLLFCR